LQCGGFLLIERSKTIINRCHMKDQFNISGILSNVPKTDERMEGVLNSMLRERTPLNSVTIISMEELLESINSDSSNPILDLND